MPETRVERIAVLPAKRKHGYIVRKFESSKHLSPQKLDPLSDGLRKHETAPEGGFADK